jgi:phosphoribosylformimino-5-aminoimidazole carboxamide ribotide isomerase
VDFTIYPAIDLRNGSVVRLKRGDPEQQTTFGYDPGATAQKWVEAGANWIHVVNLDGAFDEGGAANWRALPGILQSGAKVQFGGGLRTMKDVAMAIGRGVSRIILGTVAVEDPDLVANLISRFGSDKIVVGIDALNGQVRTHGWQSNTRLSPEILALQMRAQGVRRIIYTDIDRDGLLSGVNSEATGQLASTSGMRVIASGGVASLDDVRAAAAQAPSGVDGVIIGRALYDGQIDLTDALAIAAEIKGETDAG